MSRFLLVTEREACSAYLREAREGKTKAPSATPETVEHNGLTYIKMIDENNTLLAVYRVLTIKGERVLKRLKRWPAALKS